MKYQEYGNNNFTDMHKADAAKQLIRQQADQIRRMTPDEYIRYRKTEEAAGSERGMTWRHGN